MTAAGKEHSAARAEALVASYDGILLAALLKPPPSGRPSWPARSSCSAAAALGRRPAGVTNASARETRHGYCLV